MRQAARVSASKTRHLAKTQTQSQNHSNANGNTTSTRRSSGRVKAQQDERDAIAPKREDVAVKQEPVSPSPRKRKAAPATSDRVTKKEHIDDSPPRSAKKVKTEPPNDAAASSASPSPKKRKQKGSDENDKKAAAASNLQSAKLKKYAQFANVSPYPKYARPTAEECHKALSILESIHGQKKRPAKVKASKASAGCGDSPSVLDALVRTILSQNTSGRNSTAAKLSLDKVYGASDNWDAIMDGGEAKLVDTIRCGGLAQVKSKVIREILRQVKEKYGVYSLDHLHEVETEEAFTTLLSFQGVGPKTASCVVLFCLQRESFAVDTHVFRISKLLGWVPKEADREKAQAHLETKVPPEDKYALHILMVSHGKVCGECKAKKEVGAKCKLRDAFRGRGVKQEEFEELEEEYTD